MVNESQIEYGFVGKLQELKYVYRDDIRDRDSLHANFRKKFETLNRVRLSDSELARLLEEIIDADPYRAAKNLRQRNEFQREDGTPLVYTLVNITDWCKNDFEVVKQLRMNTANSHHRYDVILLINGLPVVQVELKTLGVNPRRAMQQIVDYKSEPGNGYSNSLLCFMQLFIVSNSDRTFYFSNNRTQHFSFKADEQFIPVYEYADRNNAKIGDLHIFAEKFLTKCRLGQMISRYMVLVESEQKILVMRPYQIYAVEDIVESIHDNRGNGYIWHTTGSGKTLTSFKASTLLKDNPDVEKCLFVVDRKDLDRQTREEFNKFQEGCVEENTNTDVLVRRMLSDDYANKVIVCTIQKLGLALDADSSKKYRERLEPLRDKRIVFIFDECHRSQFGDNHKAIKEFFPNAQLFGFTGTPIFTDNATVPQIDGTEKTLQTTEDVFQHELHSYTITHAIEDQNVLKFHIDYFRPEGEAAPRPGEPIARQAVVEAILSRHHAATHSRRFNAILATSSIDEAIDYYQLFKEIQARKRAEDADYDPLLITCVFTPPAEGNADIKQLQEDLPTEQINNSVEPEKKKEALKTIISDYNEQYGTNHTISEFDVYYQDVQQRIKFQKYTNEDYAQKNKIDIVIVVDMLLTGFDSKYLNTLYVDKKLKYHGLIQAFSRTNRILNSTKPFGNILDFRGQQEAVNKAIALFSGKDNEASAKRIWLVDPAPVVMKQYEQAVEELGRLMQDHGLPCKASEVTNLRGDAARADFINRFKEVQSLRTQLDQYTDLGDENRAAIDAMLPEDDLRAFRGAYLETARRLKVEQDKEKSNTPTPVQQLDFEFVLFASAIVDYDYIMKLIADYTSGQPGKQKMTRAELVSLLNSSANLMDERDELAAYIDTLHDGNGRTEEEIKTGYEAYKNETITRKLAEIAGEHGIDPAALQAFVDGIISRMIFDGEQLTYLLEPLELGWKARAQTETALMGKLIPQLKKLAKGHEISGLAAYE